MKICIIPHYFLPHIGGIEMVAYNHAKELAKRGHEVVVISGKIGDEPEEEFMEGFKVRRVKILNIFEKKFGIPYPVFHPKIINVIGKEIKNSDIVHIHDIPYLSSLAGLISSKIHKKPLVLMQHIKKVDDERFLVKIIQNIVYNSYGKIILNNSKEIITCNSDVKEWLKDYKNTTFIGNSVDKELFNQASKNNIIKLRKKYNLPINKNIIIFVGRLVEKKGFKKLFEAKSKDYFILFVGNGNAPKNMINSKDTKFIGGKPQKELAELYQLSDIFCLPSINEGFPLTILEAMASGLPVITTNHEGYGDYLDENYVRLITPSTKEIKKAINELIKDPKKMKQMSKWSRKVVEERFNWQKNVDKLLEVYSLTK